ncbi:AMP-binding protein [Acidovorax sp.]|uniref:AMP-binding protein n=1 Tax=Acidovorax sp. TaxID=1872122 RepID=UPI002ACD514E|nr:AMP-binding protein [Acidovorax sp.]MDZ7862953.1 AMP-binding protein [Acidovorax sp.]
MTHRWEDGSAADSVDQALAPAGLAHAGAAAFSAVLADGACARLTHAQVQELSDAFASWLLGNPLLRAGDVVAIQLPNLLHYPVAVLGAWKAAMVVSNVNPLYTARELQAQLENCRAKVLVAGAPALAGATAVAQALGVQLLVAGTHDFVAAPAGELAAAPPGSFVAALEQGRAAGLRTAQRSRVALYQYTGGTTGRSKGAALTHANLLAVLRMTGDFMESHGIGLRPSDTVLTVLPMYHIFAFVMNFLSFYRAGAHAVLVASPRPLANLRPAFEGFHLTWMSGVDTLYAGLLAEPWFRGHAHTLRYAMSGGMALRPATGEAWRASVCPMLEGYGLTETSCIVAMNPPAEPYRAGSVGLALPGSEVMAVDADGRALPAGQPGELLVKGPHVMQGYLDAPAETQGALEPGGWLRTGDIAVIGEDGYIRIVDRKKDMVLVSGFNVYPNEVEDAVAEHPAVAEVAVIGVPDEVTGEAVQAFIVAREPAPSAEELIAHCRARLTAYKVPKRIRFVPPLPKSPVGKVLRAQLRLAPWQTDPQADPQAGPPALLPKQPAVQPE